VKEEDNGRVVWIVGERGGGRGAGRAGNGGGRGGGGT